jgi:CHAD domain-containing protein
VSESIGLFLLDQFDNRRKEYRQRLKHCRKGLTEENIHQFRICCRKLLALIYLLHELAPNIKSRHAVRLLKEQLHSVDALRDTQVILLEIQDKLTQLSELSAFRLHLLAEEKKLLIQARALLNQQSAGGLQHKLNKIRHRYRRNNVRTDTKLDLLSAIGNIHIVVVDRYQNLDPNELDSIHKLRIALKKLRYVLQMIQPQLPDFPKTKLESIQAYLSVMGDIQNSSVLMQALSVFFLNAIPEDISTNFLQKQKSLLLQFLQNKEQCLDFWP